MRTRVIYSSLTGNTRRLAEAMAGALGVAAEPAKEVASLDGVELLFLGSGVYAGRPGLSMARLLRRVRELSGVRVGLFGSYGGDPNHLERMAEGVQAKGAQVIGRFSCRGRDWFALGLVARGHPSRAEVEAAAAFARQTRDRVGG
jgi:flavodoxin